MKRLWIRGGVSLLLMLLAFGGGWWARLALGRAPAPGSELVVQRDFAPTLAEAREPKAHARFSEPEMSRLYSRVLSEVKANYVEPIEESKLLQGSLKAMLSALDDPHSQYLDPDQHRRYVRALNGEVEGIGAILTLLQRKAPLKVGNTNETFTVDQRLIQVVAVVPGSPAERAGIKSGDIITHIENRWIISEDPFAEVVQLQRLHSERQQIRDADRRARERLRNALSIDEAIEKLTTLPAENDSAPLRLKVSRAGQSLEVEVARTLTRVKPIDYRLLANRWGYIRFHMLNGKAEQEFRQALKTLQKGGAKGLVLDLRQTAIGQQEPMLKLLSHLARKQTVAQVETRNGKNYTKTPLKLSEAPRPVKMPIAVLIDGGTYGVAEVMALALKSTADARLFGVPTAGDASQTVLYQLKDDSAFTLTVGRYYGVNGTDFHKKGVQPDVRVSGAIRMQGQPGGDPALDQALHWLKTAPATGSQKGGSA